MLLIYSLVWSSEARKVEESEEMILKKTERNRKRRIQAIKRREKHKVSIESNLSNLQIIHHAGVKVHWT